MAHTNLKLYREENSWKGGSMLTKLTQYKSITGTGGGLVAQSCPTLSDSLDYSSPGSSV